MNAVLRPRHLTGLAALVFGLSALACVDAHWDAVRWPAQGQGLPAQPVAESPEAGVGLRALALEWQPQAIIVELEVSNLGATQLQVALPGAMLAYGELEYAPRIEPVEVGAQTPAQLELEPGGKQLVRLHYEIGRPLTGPGAQLKLRQLSREGVALVDLPALPLPPLPARGYL